MVRAIIDGRKTQTRRLIRVPPASTTECQVFDPHEILWSTPDGPAITPVPYEPGTRLWVRETWALEDLGEDGTRLVYRSDRAARWCRLECGDLAALDENVHFLESNYRPDRWRPSIFMPRWASRLTLEITDVRVQRLQDIGEADALAEGVRPSDAAVVYQDSTRQPVMEMTARGAFASLWDSINGKRALWDSNPWVWAITFKVVSP
jgi:hypothetical protein